MLDPVIQELLGYNSSHKFTVIDRHQMFIVLLTSYRYAGIFGTDTNRLTNLRYRRIDRQQIFIVLLASHSYAGIFGIQTVSQIVNLRYRRVDRHQIFIMLAQTQIAGSHKL